MITGVELGTRHVRAVAVDSPEQGTVLATMSVALAPGVIRHGVVVDDEQLTAAFRELRRDGRFGKRIRLALASPSSVVRVVTLPTMPVDEVANAVRLQLHELVGMNAADTIVGCQLLRHGDRPAAEGCEVVVAALPKSVSEPVVAAACAARFDVVGLDQTPLALLRALPAERQVDGGAVLMSVGAGVTVIVVHEHGIPRMVRTVGVGGDDFVAAVAKAFDRTVDDAESLLYRVVAEADADHAREWAARLEPVLDRSFNQVAAEVRASVQYYLRQSGSRSIDAMVLTGGGASTQGLAERLAEVLGVAVTAGAVTDVVPDEFAGAYGAARAGAVGPLARMVLLSERAAVAERRPVPMRRVLLGAAAVAWAGALVTLTVTHDDSPASADAVTGPAAVDVTETTVEPSADQTSTTVAAPAAAPATPDFDWAGLFTDLAASAPAEISFTTLQIVPPDPSGDVAPAASDTSLAPTESTLLDSAPVPSAPQRALLTLAATAGDFAMVADWIDSLDGVRGLTEVRLGPAERGPEGRIAFTVTALVDTGTAS